MMKKTIGSFLAGVALASGSLSALADDHSKSGFYTGIDLGYAFTSATLYNEGPSAFLAPIDGFDVDNSVVFGCYLGYRLSPNLRGELDVRYREFETDGGAQPANAGSPVNPFDPLPLEAVSYEQNAEVENLSLMLNLYYDFAAQGKIIPYVKAGVGAIYNDVNDSMFIDPIFPAVDLDNQEGLTNSCPGTGRFCHPSNDEWSFAWNLGVGLLMPLTDTLSVKAEYLYIDYGDAETDADELGDSAAFDDFTGSELTLGLQYSF